jgi:transcriptional regulator BetI-like protein
LRTPRPAAEELGADPKIVASFLLAVCDGLVLQWLLDPAETRTGEELVGSWEQRSAQRVAE